MDPLPRLHRRIHREMDYGLAPCVAEAIEEATERGALGYIPDPWKKEVARSCAAWQRRYGWEVDPTCIRPVPDVLEAFEVFLREIVRAGNSIVVPTPAYMPFLSVPRLYGVEVLEIPMLCAGAARAAGAMMNGCSISTPLSRRSRTAAMPSCCATRTTRSARY